MYPFPSPQRLACDHMYKFRFENQAVDDAAADDPVLLAAELSEEVPDAAAEEGVALEAAELAPPPPAELARVARVVAEEVAEAAPEV